MNYRTVALVGLRLLAIWLIVVGIGALPQIAELWRSPIAVKGASAIRWFVIGQILMLIAPLILGVILWAISPWLCRLLAPVKEGAPAAVATPMLIQGAIAIAGLVIVVTSLPSLIYTIVTVVANIDYPSAIRLDTWARLAAQAVLVLLGFVLVVGAHRLRGWLGRVRTLNT